MIYPGAFEEKTGFSRLRAALEEACLSQLGRDKVRAMTFVIDAGELSEKLSRLREFGLLLGERGDDIPFDSIVDMRPVLARLAVPGTHIEAGDLHDLARSLRAIDTIKNILVPADFSIGDDVKYPRLQVLAEQVGTFPAAVEAAAGIMDDEGQIRDGASPRLAEIRRDMKKAGDSVSRLLYAVLGRARQEGIVEKDATPALRDGRLVIPVPAAAKRRMPGIVHDGSATGRTVFVEPAEVVEANNRLRELAAEETRETIRILTCFSDFIRPDVRYMAASYSLLAHFDFLRAKHLLARRFRAVVPEVSASPMMDWVQARHPLLEESLEKNGRKMVPLDISLGPGGRILVISGPNAGGKSVCLETAGLLQYMLQCGLAVPVRENSRFGIFSDIMLDIGDEQDMENDLSTYSSHLLNMKTMMRVASGSSLVLIDEFGSGTEPLVGGAIAEAVLEKLWAAGAFGVITTHFQNLKRFADGHPGVVNGAMLYDRRELRPLFQLETGRPGSSFAVEIARQTGIPEDVIQKASEIAGQDYIRADKYLQDITRDKRYWENKRQAARQKEKDLESGIRRYEEALADLESRRREILSRAREEAAEILAESNRRIENAVRQIRESQAEKEAVKKIRAEMDAFKAGLGQDGGEDAEESVRKKMEQIEARKERRERRRAEKKRKAAAEAGATAAEPRKEKEKAGIRAGDTVRMKGTSAAGVVEKTDGRTVTVIFGSMRSKIPASRLEKTDCLPLPAQTASPGEKESRHAGLGGAALSSGTRRTVDEHRRAFAPQMDIRGMRADEALNAVAYYIDDAILAGVSQVRILHGKGDGVLRQTVRQYLSTAGGVKSFRDEHVQFGGSGITVVEF